MTTQEPCGRSMPPPHQPGEGSRRFVPRRVHDKSFVSDSANTGRLGTRMTW
ncbi:MAG: hypothetical protein JWR33_1199 [Naasia sp.]|jgi:hypothetical protein|uniref:hypothetical protein n=1 Tax=Naasia sp. TaxID=2546198 RepID=UPI00260C292B|nr:hypothetical protein [Naasia sp.]MCU1570458.1 hypothetical protein [Naasia sp.]